MCIFKPKLSVYRIKRIFLVFFLRSDYSCCAKAKRFQISEVQIDSNNSIESNEKFLYLLKPPIPVCLS